MTEYELMVQRAVRNAGYTDLTEFRPIYAALMSFSNCGTHLLPNSAAERVQSMAGHIVTPAARSAMRLGTVDTFVANGGQLVVVDDYEELYRVLRKYDMLYGARMWAQINGTPTNFIMSLLMGHESPGRAGWRTKVMRVMVLTEEFRDSYDPNSFLSEKVTPFKPWTRLRAWFASWLA